MTPRIRLLRVLCRRAAKGLRRLAFKVDPDKGGLLDPQRIVSATIHNYELMRRAR